MNINQESIYQRIFNSALAAIGITNNEGRYILVNNTWCTLTGYTIKEATKLHLSDLTLPDEVQESDQNYRKLLCGEISSIQKIRQYKRKDGTTFWVNLYVSPFCDEEHQIRGVLGIFVDIDSQIKAEEASRQARLSLEKAHEQLLKAHSLVSNKNHELRKAYLKLEELARTDPLTGLYNRRELEHILSNEVRRTMRNKICFTIVIGDIDNFKLVNDTYGHDAGDVVLKELANILKHNVRTTDVLGRWGGEEFLVVLPETDCDGARIVIERIRQTIQEHKIKDHPQLKITMTFGFSPFTAASTYSEVLKEADLALYWGKAHGKNAALCYCEDMKAEVL
jgi:diguanylate cyclase (GGDEF)-like protein/PAS domain S-box-containing protein